MLSQSRDHISLILAEGTNEYRPTSKRKIWRWWNQLSRLQRSLFYILAIICGFLLLYLLPSDNTSAILPNDELNTLNLVNKKIVDVVPEDHKGVLEEPRIETDAIVGKIEEKYSSKIHFQGPNNERQQAVVNAFRHAWRGYKKFAWGHDHLKPITGGYHNWFGLGLTIIDSLDTMYIMNLKEEYYEARNWVAEKLRFDINKEVNLFEITIRVLGGLLSIYHLTGDQMYLDKARDLGERLLPCFDSISGIPFSDVNLQSHTPHAPKWSPDSSTSEVTTIQLEFRDLSRSTGDSRFEKAASKVSDLIHDLEKTEGLVPIFINANTGKFRSYSTITLGARGDSYYEYLLKQWLQTGKTIDYLKNDYLEAIIGVQKLLVKRTAKSNLLFIGELIAMAKDFKPKMDHLTCYLPGTLALGVHHGLPAEHLKLAEDLLHTCYQTYAQQPTFLAPEITYFNLQDDATSDMYVKTNDAHNLLRPEFLESLWYMYQLSNNTVPYQEWGWQIFQAFEKYTKVANGYTSIGNVRNILNIRPKDMMESFFLSETLKYLYLLFSDNRKELDVDKYVINSEAHPLPIHRS